MAEERPTKTPVSDCPYPTEAIAPEADVKNINKHIFVWVFAFLLGELGIDRFVRGQIGLGILKLITVGGFGLWALIDWIVALVKAYSNCPGEELSFINGKYV